MRQSRMLSAIESSCNTFSGFIVAMIVWRVFITPYLGIPVSLNTNLKVTGVFTVVSVIRGYIWRRLFSGQWRKK